MLAEVHQFAQPFEFFTSRLALSVEQCSAFARLFSEPLSWHKHGGSFYEVSNCDVTGRVPLQLQRRLTMRVSQIMDLELTDSPQITLQRMHPGQYVGVHSDRPLVGYEVVRLVLQLNEEWRPAHGGVLRIHPAEDPTVSVHQVEPNFNSAFVFALRRGSFHSVTQTRAVRRSVVFNFWHVGNSRALSEHVRRLFHGMRFSDLPAQLGLIMDVAEARYDDALTHRASCVAMVLMRWGYAEDLQVRGYRLALDGAFPSVPQLLADNSRTVSVLLLANWAVQLHVADYDLNTWQELRKYFQTHRQLWSSTARAFQELAFPQPQTAGSS